MDGWLLVHVVHAMGDGSVSLLQEESLQGH